MEQDKIVEKIEEIYVSKNKEGKPIGKNFITHLLRAYFPVDKVQKVLDIPKKPMKCAITGQKLFAIGELWEATQKEGFFNDLKKSLMVHIDPAAEPAQHPFAKVANGRVIGLVGENTDTYLCHEALQGLFNWYASKILHGDKHITWVIKDMQRKNLISTVRKRLPDAEDQKTIDRLEQISKHPQRATTSLGDMAALQALQEKLKQQEKDGNN